MQSALKGGSSATSTGWWQTSIGGVPLWGIVVAGGLILWAAGGAFHGAIVMILVAGLVYQGLKILYPKG
ncbi:MAG: hypothetical protein ACYCV4_02505 [Dermatophilaceae bacterium]